MSYRVELTANGGVDKLVLADFEPASPRDGELLVRNSAIGLNFAEIYFRTGQKGPHKAGDFPAVPGSNGAGIVEAVGPDVQDFKPGDRVAYVAPHCYASHVSIAAHRAVSLPEDLSDRVAAAAMLRGLTAEYLIYRLFKVEPGMFCLVHAAAGGVGQLLAQWLNARGAVVIGTAGGPEKVEIARAAGCHHVIDYRSVDFRTAVAKIVPDGVHVVYDAVGKDVFFPSLDCLRVRGMIASYGAASGPVAPLDIQLLHEKALFVTRPTLRSYISTGEMLRGSADRFFTAVQEGAIVPRVDREYCLKDVQRAHWELESRQTTGSAILIP